jgi:hypothetical protein
MINPGRNCSIAREVSLDALALRAALAVHRPDRRHNRQYVRWIAISKARA